MGSNSLKSGLVGWWTFDGPHMIENAADISGSGNHGSLSGQTSTTTVPGRIGQAMSFDGVDDYVDVGTSIAPADEITICAWVYRKSDGFSKHGTSAYQDIIVRSSTSNQANFVFEFNGGNLVFNTQTLPPFLRVSSGTDSRPFKLNTWMHLCSVYSDQNVNDQALYYNGESLFLTETDTDTLTTNTETVFIGGRSGGSDILEGMLDDVRIYDRTLSSDEVRELYNMGR